MIACHWLRMKPPIIDRRIFSPTIRTHSKGRHRRLLPIVRQIADDRKAGAAMRAIDKRILQAMRLHLTIVQALRADGNIGSHLRHLVGVGTAGRDRERRINGLIFFYFFHPDAMNRGHLSGYSCRMREIKSSRCSGVRTARMETPLFRLSTSPFIPISLAMR